MADRLERGQLWLLDRPSTDRRRPVLVLSRPVLLRVLHTATVAAVTSTMRGSPTEVRLGVQDGLKHDSCVNLANVFTIPQAQLRHYIGSVSTVKMREVCHALMLACGCD